MKWVETDLARMTMQPTQDREAWESLWREVDALLASVGKHARRRQGHSRLMNWATGSRLA